jgi:hypothetical protein
MGKQRSIGRIDPSNKSPSTKGFTKKQNKGLTLDSIKETAGKSAKNQIHKDNLSNNMVIDSGKKMPLSNCNEEDPEGRTRTDVLSPPGSKSSPDGRVCYPGATTIKPVDTEEK